MSGSHPLLQVHRVIKELRIALVLSQHDGNTAFTDHRNLLHYFLFKTSDLGNTPLRFDPFLPFQLWCEAFHEKQGLSIALPIQIASCGMASQAQSAMQSD